MDDALSTATHAAEAGAQVAAESFRSEVAVETKTHKNDLVSAADRAAQERVLEILSAESDAPVVGEEDGARGTVPDAGPAWIVDPIDGTANFLRGMRTWATSVAAVVDGSPVAGVSVLPALEDTYAAGADGLSLNGDPVTVSDRTDVETFAVAVLGWGANSERDPYARLSEAVVTTCGDMRRLGSMQAALAHVAAGSLDGAITTRSPHPWDAVAGVHMVREAGGRVTDLAGGDWHLDSPQLVASNGQRHGEVLAVAREALA